MHAIIAAVVAVLLCLLLFKVIRKQRLIGAPSSGAGMAQRAAFILALAGLALIVIGWLGVTGLSWGAWLVWVAVAIYLISAIVRAAQRVK
jgi:phosphatidylglycerophosphate synthase